MGVARTRLGEESLPGDTVAELMRSRVWVFAPLACSGEKSHPYLTGLGRLVWFLFPVARFSVVVEGRRFLLLLLLLCVDSHGNIPIFACDFPPSSQSIPRDIPGVRASRDRGRHLSQSHAAPPEFAQVGCLGAKGASLPHSNGHHHSGSVWIPL